MHLAFSLFLPRLLRLTAYRQFTYWAHQRLGRGVRIVVPSCIVSAVRRAFPEESGHYVGFREANDAETLVEMESGSEL